MAGKRTIGDYAREQGARHPSEGRTRGRHCAGDPARSTEPMVFMGAPRCRYAPAEGESSRTVPVIEVADIATGVVSPDAHGTFEVSRRAMRVDGSLRRQLTRRDDVLVSLRPPFRAVVVDRRHAGALPGTGFAVIRLDGESAAELDPHYLAALLSGPAAAATLAATMGERGARTAVVGDLLAVEVPDMDPVDRRALGAARRSACESLSRALRRLGAANSAVA